MSLTVTNDNEPTMNTKKYLETSPSDPDSEVRVATKWGGSHKGYRYFKIAHVEVLGDEHKHRPIKLNGTPETFYAMWTYLVAEGIEELVFENVPTLAKRNLEVCVKLIGEAGMN